MSTSSSSGLVVVVVVVVADGEYQTMEPLVPHKPPVTCEVLANHELDPAQRIEGERPVGSRTTTAMPTSEFDMDAADEKGLEDKGGMSQPVGTSQRPSRHDEKFMVRFDTASSKT